MERRAPAAWKALLDRVEEILIRYPIPLLQRVGSRRVNLLFNPEAWPLKGKGLRLGAYFRSRRAEGGGFDNRVLFNPGPSSTSPSWVPSCGR